MSLAEKLRKTNWLNELRLAVITGIGLILAISAAEIIQVAFGAEVTVEMPGDAAGPAEFQLGGQTMRRLSTEVLIVDPTPSQAWWYLATWLPTAAVLLGVMLLLLRLLSRSRRAHPFTRDTVRDLRWLAAVLLFGGSLAGLAEFAATIGISRELATGMTTGYWNLPLIWPLAGFGAAAVAEIVARGCAMREELDEVV